MESKYEDRGSSRSSVESKMIDVSKARQYMKEKAEPIITQLVQELAVEQPEDIMAFIEGFAKRNGQEERGHQPSLRHSREETKESEFPHQSNQVQTQETQERHDETNVVQDEQDTEYEENYEYDDQEEEEHGDDYSEGKNDQPEDSEEESGQDEEIEQCESFEPKFCCVSGTPAELKVKLPGSDQIEYYARDIFDALKRKNKLRGAIAVELDESFPEIEVKDEAPFPLRPDELERIATVQTVDERDSRPVTPPKRGFEMTRPGENYHNGEGPRIVGNVGPVKFEPRALGESNAEDRKLASIEAAEKRAKEGDHLTEEQREELKVKRKKDELLGKIIAHYAAIGQDQPFGLAAASIETLQRHMAKLKIRTEQVVQEREEDVRTHEQEQRARSMLKHFKTGGAQVAPASGPVSSTVQAVSFEPRALGTASNDHHGEEGKREDTPQSRRERAARAAARRFQQVN